MEYIENKIPFKEYFKKISGDRIEINHYTRVIEIYNAESEHIKTLYFSKTISRKFNVPDLFEVYLKEGEYLFYVWENGYEDKDWLYILIYGGAF